jgi:hypothetical protein
MTTASTVRRRSATGVFTVITTVPVRDPSVPHPIYVCGDLWLHVRSIVTWLNARNGKSEHETAMRLIKVAEEAGEASAAYIGTQGQNPRKGITHTPADVADELCDVIVAAMVALHSFTRHPEHTLNTKIDDVLARVREQMQDVL